MSWKSKPIYYDKLTTAERKRLAANKSAYFQKFGKPAKMNIISGSSTTAQAKRTGGWANPTKGGEIKFLDNAPAGSITAGSTAFTAAVLLNGCTNGSDASTRIGRKITMKSILVRYNAALHASSTGGGNFRVLVVYDKQANAAFPTIASILEQTSGTSPMNMDNRDRFSVLIDKQIAIDQFGGNGSRVVKLFKRSALPTIFNSGTTGTVADMTTGSVYLVLLNIQAGAVVTDTNPDIAFKSRIRFDDS